MEDCLITEKKKEVSSKHKSSKERYEIKDSSESNSAELEKPRMRSWNLIQGEKKYCRSSKMTLANREEVMAEMDLHCTKRET